MNIDVRALRNEFGLTLDQMASIIGCTASTLSRLQRDASRADPSSLRMLLAFQKVKDRGHDTTQVGAAVRMKLQSEGDLAALYLLLHFALHLVPV